MSDISRIKDRIKNLLNLAENDGAMDGEVDNALRFARRLMLKHNLDEADVKDAQGAHEKAADYETTEYTKEWTRTVGTRFTAWETELMFAIQELIGTVKWFRGSTRDRMTKMGTIEFNPVTGMPAKVRQVVFYGPKGDVADALEMVREWQETIVTMARLRFGGALRGPGKSYAEGFARSLLLKVRAIHREERLQIKGGGSTALTLVRSTDLMLAKQKHADVWLEQSAGIRLTKGTPLGNGSHDSSAFTAGKADGSRANFSQRRKLGN